jgi:hypothetical protein
MSGKAWLWIVTLAFVPLGSGCRPFEIGSSRTWFPSGDEAVAIPATLTAVWSNAVLDRAENKRARGFAGRLMFYGPGKDEPVRVDGTLVVYAYNEAGRNPHDTRPDRKYAFTREQFASHYSKSDLGASYSIWIPWDEVGGSTVEVSLVARFNPAEGSPIVGTPTKLTLPGQDLSEHLSKDDGLPGPSCSTPSAVRQTAHETPIAEGAAKGDGATSDQMITATIPVPARGQK